MFILVQIQYNAAFEPKIILTYACGNGPLKIRREVFTRGNIGGWGLNMETCRVRRRGRKEGKGS
jgi:hypothetical protein